MARPLQVLLEPADLDRLDTWSEERGFTKSQAVRLAIRALTRPHEGDPLLGASGMIDGLPADLAEHFDRHLEETFIVTKQKKPRTRKARFRR